MAEGSDHFPDPFLARHDGSGSPTRQEELQWQYQNADPSAYTLSAATASPWQGRLANQPERAPWSSQIANSSSDHSQEELSPNKPFPDLPDDMPASALPCSSGQTTAKPSPRQSPSREGSYTGNVLSEAIAKTSRRQSPSRELANSSNSPCEYFHMSYYPSLALNLTDLSFEQYRR